MLVCEVSHFKRSEGVGGSDPPEPVPASKERHLSDGHGAPVRPLTKLNGFSPISPMPCTWPGLLFLTSLSYTDPDQFVYKTRPPRERPDTSPDVMMNSYLGLWPEMTNELPCSWSFKNCFWSIQSINLLIFSPISSETHTKSMLDLPGGFQRWVQLCLPCSELGAHHIFSSPHNLRTATVVVMLLINKTQQKGWS